MDIKLYQVDAFTSQLFSGNSAAVCPLDEWIDHGLMQKIAMENNLSETAFYVKKGDVYDIRWFTPTVEVDLCGHATLATAYILFNLENHDGNSIEFYSHRSGTLTVTKKGDWLNLNFPVDVYEPVPSLENVAQMFDVTPVEIYKGKTDYLFCFENETQIQHIKPNFLEIKKLSARGVMVTAKGDTTDFVSRFFGPQSGIEEDPVTGSAHTTLVPYWSSILGKKHFTAKQLSERGGFLKCELMGDRVLISGQAKLYLSGKIHLD